MGNGVTASAARLPFIRRALGVSLLLATASVAPLASAQTEEPYSYYGGEIDVEEKNAAIEACEYQLLVEEQRCNLRANKSRCIKEVHRECREEYADANSTESKPEDN